MIVALSPSACGCRKFALDALWDHVKLVYRSFYLQEAHDCAVEQLGDLFCTTLEVKTQQVAQSRDQRCGDIELAAYLADAAGPA